MITKQQSLKVLFHSLSVLGIIATIIFCIYGYKLGIFQSTDMLSEFISQIGYLGILAFIFIQVVQVVIPIIPGGISCLAGVILFGPVYGFLYNYIGIVIGSIINFLLARRYGKPFVQSIVSQKTYDKYIGWLDRGTRFDKFFATAIFFPISPDDFLCLLAGLTRMTLKKFTTIILFCKPVSIIVYSLGLKTIMHWVTVVF